MNQVEFHQVMSGLGLRTAGDRAFGAWRGWPIVAVRTSPCVRIQLALSGKPAGTVIKAANQELKPLKSSAAAGAVQLLLDVTAKSGNLAQRIPAALDIVLGALREAGITPPRTCPLCRAGGCDSMALIGQDYVPVHRTCVEGQTQGVTEKMEQNMVSGNYVTGFIGAILGGIVGTLPTVLLILASQRIFSVLYALIPICAYYGYKLLRGKMNKAAFVCTLLSSVLNLFSIHFLTNYISLCGSLGRLISLPVSLRMYIDLIQSGSLTTSLAQSALFLGLGLWFSWGIITRTAKQDVQQAVSVLSTLQPLGGAGVQE